MLHDRKNQICDEKIQCHQTLQNELTCLSGFAVDNSDVLFIPSKPSVDVLAERLDQLNPRWIMVVERKMFHASVESVLVVRSFRAAEIEGQLPSVLKTISKMLCSWEIKYKYIQMSNIHVHTH